MSREDFKIKYANFKPCPEIDFKIKSIAEDIFYSSPSDSLVKLEFEKVPSHYSCRMEVNSSLFKEKALSQSPDLMDCVENGFKSLRFKLNQWKQFRFSEVAV